jgi:adenylate cyclase
MVDKTCLPNSYWQKQTERVTSTVKRMEERKAAVAAGRVIPDSGDMPIATGRQLDATVLFLDISKFSSIPAGDPAEQHALMLRLALFFSEMIRIVEDYDGTVEKNTGDGLMAYFVNSDGETAQTKAVASALTMIKAADGLIAPVFQSYGLEPFKFRICLDHGPITVAEVGASKRFKGIVAIGATANIACKILALAEPNSILIGDMVRTGLPPDWVEKYVRLRTTETGWIYIGSGKPYPIYEYIGRWL